MTTTSSGGAVLLYYADCKYVVLGNRNMKAVFLCTFPPDAELATMQDEKSPKNTVVNGLAT